MPEAFHPEGLTEARSKTGFFHSRVCMPYVPEHRDECALCWDISNDFVGFGQAEPAPDNHIRVWALDPEYGFHIADPVYYTLSFEARNSSTIEWRDDLTVVDQVKSTFVPVALEGMYTTTTTSGSTYRELIVVLREPRS